jgi:hypothetical protein
MRLPIVIGSAGYGVEAVAVSSIGADSDGAAFNPDSLPQTLGYTDGKLTTVTVTDGTSTWAQTLGYTGDNLTSVSAWVKQ